MKKVLVLAVHGNEAIEVISPVDVLRRGGNKVSIVTMNNDDTVKLSTGLGETTIMADAKLKDVNLGDFDLVMIAGGAGHQEYLDKPVAKEVLSKFAEQGKYVSAICAASGVLGKLGFLNGQKGCCYPGFELGEGVDWQNQHGVVVSNKFITSRGPEFAIDFGLAMVEALNGKKVRDEVAGQVLAV